jgi:hypothetical protein
LPHKARRDSQAVLILDSCSLYITYDLRAREKEILLLEVYVLGLMLGYLMMVSGQYFG